MDTTGTRWRNAQTATRLPTVQPNSPGTVGQDSISQGNWLWLGLLGYLLATLLGVGVLCGCAILALAKDSQPLKDSPGAIIIISLACIFNLVICVVVPVGVYKDAKNRGMDSAMVWAGTCVLWGWLALIVYLLWRPVLPENHR